jgi:3-hydroxyacyl-[acyl-carrier-protein] dehydratase
MNTPPAATPPDQGLLDSLPHRPPFLFLTDLLERTAERGEAIWRVTGHEPFFEGHFPDAPLVPGTLLTEAMAQLSGLVAFAAGEGGAAPFAKLVHVDIRFKESVAPPAEIHLFSRSCGVFGKLHQFDVTARSAGRVVARGRLVLAQSERTGEVRP